MHMNLASKHALFLHEAPINFVKIGRGHAPKLDKIHLHTINRGVGRSRIFGGGASVCARAPATDDNQNISVHNIILGVQGAESPEALEILSNLWAKSN